MAARMLRDWPESVQNQLGGVRNWQKGIEGRFLAGADLHALADENARILHAETLPQAQLLV